VTITGTDWIQPGATVAEHTMTAAADDDMPVRVTLTVSDWMTVPARAYSKTIEFERGEWDAMTPVAREEMIEEELEGYLLDTFGRDYTIEGGSLDDPTEG
jgi:hypothetical protein